MIENDLIFFETKIKIKINFYKFTGGDLDHLKDQVQLKDLDLFHQDQLILNNPALGHDNGTAILPLIMNI